jgi:hypothetical protein
VVLTDVKINQFLAYIQVSNVTEFHEVDSRMEHIQGHMRFNYQKKCVIQGSEFKFHLGKKAEYKHP